MSKFSSNDAILSFFSLVFQVFKAVGGILHSLPIRSVYSVCKLHHPQTPESKANQEEKRRLAPYLCSQRTCILFTGDSTDRTPSKPPLVPCNKGGQTRMLESGCFGLVRVGHAHSLPVSGACTPWAARMQPGPAVRVDPLLRISLFLFSVRLFTRPEKSRANFEEELKILDGMAVLSCSPHSGLVSKDWPPRAG